jgi:hypothetical protein
VGKASIGEAFDTVASVGLTAVGGASGGKFVAKKLAKNATKKKVANKLACIGARSRPAVALHTFNLHNNSNFFVNTELPNIQERDQYR